MEFKKFLTFSYDDGVTQDIRLIELFNKYGMRATFNLNSARLGEQRIMEREGRTVNHNKIKHADIKYVYEGHEIAAHTLTHPNLRLIENDDKLVREVEQDRLILSELCGYEVVGMAYPGGSPYVDARVVDLVKTRTGIRYARNTTSNFSFDVQTELIDFCPSVYHHKEMDRMFALGEQFLQMKPEKKQIYYVWGHAYEFDIHDTWDQMEEFLKMMSRRDDICYCTNREALLELSMP
ncbi:MAG: polysaccharide deacetylase [Ruminococcaceae bacterium]|nr:polysaccharide deacetylase [Oscillospiraceae bacterium]